MDLTFDFAYGSGHYSESARHLERWLDDAMRVASLVSGTEVYSKARVAALNERRWRHHRGKSGDAEQLYCCWDTAVWEVIAQEEHALTKRRYVREGGATAPADEVLVTVLRHRESRKVLAHLQHHLPAGIEGHAGPGGIYKAYYRATVSADAIRGAHKIKRDVAHRFNPDAVMLGGDWNLNFERTAVRAFVKAIFPRGVVNFRKYTGLGTLGNRFIDVFLTWGLRVVTNPTVRRSDASDHNWYVQRLSFD